MLLFQKNFRLGRTFYSLLVKYTCFTILWTFYLLLMHFLWTFVKNNFACGAFFYPFSYILPSFDKVLNICKQIFPCIFFWYIYEHFLKILTCSALFVFLYTFYIFTINLWTFVRNLLAFGLLLVTFYLILLHFWTFVKKLSPAVHFLFPLSYILPSFTTFLNISQNFFSHAAHFYLTFTQLL